jgi:hypothetical protein
MYHSLLYDISNSLSSQYIDATKAEAPIVLWGYAQQPGDVRHGSRTARVDVRRGTRGSIEAL